MLKDWLGSQAVAPSAAIELPEGATVAALLERLRTALPAGVAAEILGSIAVSVNAVYAQAAHILHDGDEVGLLPPVSGGSTPRADTAQTASPARTGAWRTASPARTANLLDESGKVANLTVALTRERIDAEQIVAAAKSGEDGAVVVFDGIVRNHSRGRRTLHLDYEAYEEMALGQMHELALKARERFSVRQVTMVHRLGRLEIGETSVLIVVASAHRSAAFEACRWLIDTLKQTVPIWKKETFVDGAVWAPGEPFPKEIALKSREAPHEK